MKKLLNLFLKEYKFMSIFILITCILPRLFQFGVVPTNSMEPTFPVGTIHFFGKWPTTYNAGDIIVFRPAEEYDEGHLVAKRIVATAGDTIKMVDGTLFVNGVEVNYTFLTDHYEISPPEVIPEGYVYVLGDNRPVSLDSREQGAIKLSQIKGKVYFSLIPFKWLT